MCVLLHGYFQTQFNYQPSQVQKNIFAFEKL